MSTPVIGAAGVKPAVNEGPADYKRIYVWQFPVRLFHWATALSIVLLCVTGFLIGHPLHAFYAEEAYQQYWFGWVRFVHFASAFVLVAVSGLRLYWAFVGNQYANWRNFIPLTRAQWASIWELIQVEVLQIKKHGRYHVGHNTMAATSYFFLFLAFVFQTVTGFALYSSMSGMRITHVFDWIVPLMGGDAGVRFWHHAFMWIFVVFIIVHVYLGLYDDYVEGGGEMSAMISGWKFKRDKSEK
ncbi:MAG: Ni/Fe-hydrogenase, b-type cytochrome subunit [Acidobacteriaceae bacterium]